MATFPEVLQLTSQPRIYSNVPVYSSDSISLIQKKRKIPAQRWEFTVDVLAHGIKDINKADAWVFSQNGSFETFTFSLDINKKPDNVANQALVSTSGAIGDSEISVTPIANLTADDEGFYIRVTGDTKVYMVTGISKNGAIDTLNIFPPLRKSVTPNAIVHLDAEFTVRLEDNITSGDYGSSRKLKNWNLKLIEAL